MYLLWKYLVIFGSKLLQWSRFLVGITVFKFLRKFRNVWWHGKCQRSGPHIIILRKGWHLSDFLQIVFHILALKTQQFWTFMPRFLKQYMYNSLICIHLKMILTLTILQVVASEDDYFLLLCYKRNPQRLMSLRFLKIQLGEYVKSIIYS